MNFDESINKLLHEAYFSSPHEKATGIKRHVGIQEDEGSEFSQTKERKNDVIELSAMVASELMNDAMQSTDGASMPKKGELVDAVITILHNYAQKNTMAGDEFTLDDWKNYLTRISELTSEKAPVSAERVRNVLQQAMLTLKAKLGGPSIRQSAEQEPYENPEGDEYRAASDKLKDFRKGV